MIIAADHLQAIVTDRVGVCMGCGAMTDPVPAEACGLTCGACRHDLVVGIVLAIELGAIRIQTKEE